MTFQNFVSAAVGMAVLIAMIRGFIRSRTPELGNFWRDTVRGVVYILLPVAAILAVILITQGVVQTYSDSAVVHGHPGVRADDRPRPRRLADRDQAAGDERRRVLQRELRAPVRGSGRAFGNFLELLSILLIPAALTYTFGKMVGKVREGWAIYAAMMVLFIAGLWLTVPQEHTATQAMRTAGIEASAPNMEGKELRYGPDQSSLWAVATTDASNGSVNSMHDSYKPYGMVAPMFNMAIGEVIFGGVGSGLYGMIFYVIIAVFIGGLMVGRTPEYLGKKIGARQVKLAADRRPGAVPGHPRADRVAVVTPAGTDPRLNMGPHGFSEIFYAFTVHGEQQRVGVRRDSR